MPPGLPWIRQRQRRLARALLPVFALVWLQLAAMPCVGAHQAAAELATEAPAADHPGGHHDGDHEHCPYCPTSGGTTTLEHCDDGGQCAYPHEPGVDARFASMAVLPTPAATPLEGLLAAPCSLVGVRTERPDAVPRRPLSISYCRFIE